MSEVQTEQVFKGEREYLEDIKDALLQIEEYNELLKDAKNSAKKAGFDPSILVTVAKAELNGKVSELREKYESTLDLLEE